MTAALWKNKLGLTRRRPCGNASILEKGVRPVIGVDLVETSRRVMDDFMKFLLSVGENSRGWKELYWRDVLSFCLSAQINFLIITPAKV